MPVAAEIKLVWKHFFISVFHLYYLYEGDVSEEETLWAYSEELLLTIMSNIIVSIQGANFRAA